MNISKRNLLKVIVIVFIITVFLSGCNNVKTEGDFQYIKYSLPESSITKYIGKGGDVIIPSRFGAYVVCGIDEGAFSGCTGLLTIKIPDTIRIIHDSAFMNCTNLQSVYFEGNAPELGDDVFHNTAPNFTIYYHADKSGWSEQWNAYNTSIY
jgi:hypothetical protein